MPYSPLYALLVGALVLVFAMGTFRLNTFYRTHLTEAAESSRFLALDGLRGLFALGVVLHHAAISFRFHAGDGA